MVAETEFSKFENHLKTNVLEKISAMNVLRGKFLVSAGIKYFFTRMKEMARVSTLIVGIYLWC